MLDAEDKIEQVKSLLPLRYSLPTQKDMLTTTSSVVSEGCVGTKKGVYSDKGQEEGFRKSSTQGVMPELRLEGTGGMVSK